MMSRVIEQRLTRRSLVKAGGALSSLWLATSLLAACAVDDDDAPAAPDDTADDTVEDEPDDEVDDSDPEEPQAGGTWTIAITEEPDTMDPQRTSAAITGLIFRYLGDSLVVKNFDSEIIPGLAQDYEVSDDGNTWTFHLKEGVTFHDGTALDAESARASFERALDPETSSPIAGSLLGPVESIEAIDELSLAIELDEPFAIFLDNMTDPRSALISVVAVEELGDQFGRLPVSTGPWSISEWQSGARIVLERFEDYAWAPEYSHDGAAFIDRIEFRVMPEAATAVTAFEAGEIDQVGIPPTDVSRLEQVGQYEIVSFLRLGVGLFMEFNVTRDPFDDLNVRRAFNHAIDKQDVLDTGIEGRGVIAHGPLPPSIWGYWEGIEEYAPGYDPDAARELLAEAGWEEDDQGQMSRDGEPFEFVLMTLSQDTWTNSAQVVQSHLAELGIDMEIQTFEFGTLLENMQAGDHEAGFMGYTYTSPDIVQLWFHSSNIGSGLTLSHNDDPELDALIDESRREVDEDRRLEIYEEIQRKIVDDALWVPLWTNDNFIGLQPRIENARVHPEGFIVLFDAQVTDD